MKVKIVFFVHRFVALLTFAFPDVISVYLDVNPTQVEPLLREIFDLKV